MLAPDEIRHQRFAFAQRVLCLNQRRRGGPGELLIIRVIAFERGLQSRNLFARGVDGKRQFALGDAAARFIRCCRFQRQFNTRAIQAANLRVQLLQQGGKRRLILRQPARGLTDGALHH